MKKWTEEDIIKIIDIMKMLTIDSLNRRVSSEPTNPTELGDTIEDLEPGPQELAEQTDRARLIKKMLNDLSPREQRVIILRYGLETGIPKTLEELGETYGVTRERIRQVERNALKKLRRIIVYKYKLKVGDI